MFRGENLLENGLLRVVGLDLFAAERTSNRVPLVLPYLVSRYSPREEACQILHSTWD